MSAHTRASGRSFLRLTAAAAVLLLGLSVAGCGGGDDKDDESSKSMPSATVDGAADGNNGDDADANSDDDANSDSDTDTDTDTGRAFDGDDDAVVGAVIAATRADRAEWDGKTLIVHFNEGSASDPMSGTKCGAAIVLADDEKAIMRFPDGEIDCSQR